MSPLEDLDDVGGENVDDNSDGALNFEDLDSSTVILKCIIIHLVFAYLCMVLISIIILYDFFLFFSL